MPKKINDSVFGEMECYHQEYIKKKKVPFLNQMCEVEILVKTYNESILDKQQEAYKYFLKNHEKVNSEIPKLIKDYIDENREEIRHYYPEIDNIKNLSDLIKSNSLRFNRDGSVVFLCDVPWDEEHGIGIQIYPEYKIDIQDNFI